MAEPTPQFAPIARTIILHEGGGHSVPSQPIPIPTEPAPPSYAPTIGDFVALIL